MKINAVDLFCGAGGLTQGLLDAGVIVKAGIDTDSKCKYPYVSNNRGAKFVAKSVETITREEIESLLPRNDVRLIAGCAPCQPFSKYRFGEDTRKDQKWGLLYHFERIVREIRPELVTMENVPQLAKHTVFGDFNRALDELGYHVSFGTMDCRKYGVPQHRNRIVLIASLLGPIDFPSPTHSDNEHVTVENAISHLPAIDAGQQDTCDPLHLSAKLSDLNLKRIRQSRPGGTWRDWDEELVAKCHKKASGKTFPSVYGRMKWDEPAPTMTTQCYGYGNGRFGHPVQDRGISLREAAIFQTFPENYKFVPDGGSVEIKSIGRMIGNAVPVKVGEVIGRHLVKHVYTLISAT